MSNSFTKKRLDLTITLGVGTFGETVGDTVTLRGLRMMADLVSPVGDSMGALQMRVYGMTQSLMNQLTTLGNRPGSVRGKNSIVLAAGDDSGMKLVFSGTIYDGWTDYSSQPDVGFNIIAYAGMTALVKPVGALSYKGAADVATIMSGLADTMGFAFENNEVSVQLSNPYFPGTALMQVRACAEAADIRYAIDRGVLAIWPKTGSRIGDILLVSPETGMVDYPSLNSAGMSVKTLFNPGLRPGGDVRVKSSIPMACGVWHVGPFSHSLSSEIQGGPWFSTFQCSYVSE